MGLSEFSLRLVLLVPIRVVGLNHTLDKGLKHGHALAVAQKVDKMADNPFAKGVEHACLYERLAIRVHFGVGCLGTVAIESPDQQSQYLGRGREVAIREQKLNFLLRK